MLRSYGHMLEDVATPALILDAANAVIANNSERLGKNLWTADDEGEPISVYAAYCQLLVERRTSPGETVPAATAELQALLDDLAAADSDVKGTVRATFDRDPFEVSAEAAIVRALTDDVRQVQRQLAAPSSSTPAGSGRKNTFSLHNRAACHMLVMGSEGSTVIA